VCSDLSELAQRLDDWRDLARESLEPNAFWEPYFMLPAFAHLPGRERFGVVVIDITDRRLRRRVLAGIFPFELRRSYRGVPVSVLALWRNRYAFLATPLVRRPCASMCLDALCEWHARGPFRRALLEFGEIRGDGPFLRTLAASVNRAGSVAATTSGYWRALMRLEASAEEFELVSMPTRRRRECRRRLKRLGERGSVTFSDLGAGDDAASWFRAFLTLERSGWKGRRGSAMLARRHDGFFEEMAGGAHALGQLGMSRLALDGRPVAMSCRLHSGRAAFGFKMAYDETLARYSPGILLELHNIRRMHERRDIAWIDSCGKPGDLFTSLWRERLEIRTVLVGSKWFPSSALARIAGVWSRLRSTGRRA
jgi:CelD/BcsL family acetyltransferase involved in cellulose biosynthesis